MNGPESRATQWSIDWGDSMTDEQRQMIADCEARESRLTDWQRGFIDNLSRLPDDWQLSEKQESALERVWDNATRKG